MAARSLHYRRELRAVAKSLGFEVAATRGGHQVARHRSGAVVFFASTSVSPRGFRNAIAMLRRTARQAGAAGGAR
jgi:hypothetical protein